MTLDNRIERASIRFEEVPLSSRSGASYAVLDVETTGLFATRGDRIIELAIIRLDQDGTYIDEFATLVNPRRDVGARHVHGLTATDLVNAPVFDETLAAHVLERLSGCVLVGHNIRFDLEFLRAELERLGVQLPNVMSVCTLQLASRLGVRAASRKLVDLCKALSIPIDQAHCAADDARATGQLFAHCLRHGPTLRDELFGSGRSVLRVSINALPELRLVTREVAARPANPAASFLAQLVARLPHAGDESASLSPYFDLLDRALEDRLLTGDEARELEACAARWGLSSSMIASAHEAYFSSVATVAAADGRISDSEQRDLRQLAAMLGLHAQRSEDLVGLALRTAAAAPASAETSDVEPALKGQSVCFTGELFARIGGEVITRARAEELATEHGLTVLKSVTKKLDLLVVADPNTQSGKAQKARSYGTRIMAESVFWSRLGVGVD